MKLLIAIPACREETSIESIISRSLDARENIIRNSPITDAEVLGCRMNPDSKMPFLRRVDNPFFANLLRVLSSEPVRDAASGIRVVCGAGETVSHPRWSSLHHRHERASRTRWRGPGGRDRHALPRAAAQVEAQRPPLRGEPLDWGGGR